MLKWLATQYHLKVLFFVAIGIGSVVFSAHAETFSPSDGNVFLLGSGYNSVTGMARANCVEMSDVVRSDMPSNALIGNPQAITQCTPSGQCVDFTLSQVNSASTLRRALDINAKASFGFGIFSGDASAKFLEENQYTNNSIYIVLKVKIRNTSERLKELNLVDWARKLLTKGEKDSFLTRCGDAFIAGRTTGGEFSAVIKISTKSEENKRSILAKLSTSGITWSASASVASALSKISRENHVEIHMFKKGGIGALPDHTDIDTIFKFARELPSRVQTDTSPSIYLFSTMDYSTTSNFPSENTSLFQQRHVLESIAAHRDEAFEKFGNADYVLTHPNQFERFDMETVASYRKQMSEIIQSLNDSARYCESYPVRCELPQISWPQFKLPVRMNETNWLNPVTGDDPRIADAPQFRQLGEMFEAVGLIWSGNSKMKFHDAEEFCKNLDSPKGGARLPTESEYRALARFMGKGAPGRKYDQSLIPSFSIKYDALWTSTLQREDFNLAFYTLKGYFVVQNHDFKLPFKCVRSATW
jgi:hypothetical protein